MIFIQWFPYNDFHTMIFIQWFLYNDFSNCNQWFLGFFEFCMKLIIVASWPQKSLLDGPLDKNHWQGGPPCQWFFIHTTIFFIVNKDLPPWDVLLLVTSTPLTHPLPPSSSSTRHHPHECIWLYYIKLIVQLRTCVCTVVSVQ